MRATIWLLGLLWRAGASLATLVRYKWSTGPFGPKVAFDEMSGRLDGTPRANLASYLAGDPNHVVAEMRALAKAWAASFCGTCDASPDHPESRCGKCLDLVQKMLNDRAIGPEQLERVVEYVRRGDL